MMKFLDKWRWLFVVLGVFLVVSLVYGFAQTNSGSAADGVSGTVSGLRLPLSWWDNGKLKSQLKADKATVPDNGPIFATSVTGEFFTIEGDLDVLMTADDCIYDRQAKVVRSDSKIRVERKDAVITGRGFEWDSNEQVIRITNDVKVVISRAMIRKNGIKGKIK